MGENSDSGDGLDSGPPVIIPAFPRVGGGAGGGDARKASGIDVADAALDAWDGEEDEDAAVGAANGEATEGIGVGLVTASPGVAPLPPGVGESGDKIPGDDLPVVGAPDGGGDVTTGAGAVLAGVGVGAAPTPALAAATAAST